MNKNLAKNLILLLISAITLGLFAFVFAPETQAAFGLNTSFKQVKTADSPVVYYLDHQRGLKKAYASAAAFLSYGNKWPDVKIVSQAELDKWPDVKLVKADNSREVFYVNGDKKALIESEQQFMDYGFMWSDIVTIKAADLAEYKLTDFDKVKASLFEPSANPAANGLLKIEPAAVDASSLYLPTGSRGNAMAAFRLSALDAEVKISQLIFTQSGVSPDQAVSAVYLTDEAGQLYGEKQTLNGKQFQLNLAASPLIINAGQSKVFYLRADIAAGSNLSGLTMKFGLVNPLDVTADSSVSAAFPLYGPEFRLADGGNVLGRVTASQLSLTSAGDQIALGSTNKPVMKIRLAETSGNEDVLIRQIVLTGLGSAADADLRNLSLVDQDGRQVMKVQTMINQKATFILQPGYWLKKNHYADFTLKTGVIGGDGRTVSFTLADANDVDAVGKATGYDLAVNLATANTQPDIFTIKRSPVFLTAPAAKAAELAVYRDQDEAVLGTFELRNNTSDVKLKSLTLSIVKSADAPALDQPVVALDAKTGQELGQIDPARVTDKAGDLNLNNLTAAKGQTVKFKFVTHIPDSALSGASYQVLVKSVNYNAGGSNVQYSDQVDVYGQKRETVRPAMYLYAGEKDADDVAAAGDDKVIVGFFRLEATDETDLRITSITIANAGGFTPVNYANGFTNLTLYKGGSKISQVMAEPNENVYCFTGLKAFLAAGTAADFYVKADLAANAKGAVKLTMDNAVVEAYSSKIPGEVSNKGAASPEVAISQTAVSASAVSAGAVARGTKNNLLASFTFTNNSAEKVRLNKVVLDSAGLSGNLSNNNGFSNLRFGYVNVKGKIMGVGGRLVKPVADVNEISLSGRRLNPGETLTLNLYVDAGASVPAGDITITLSDILAVGVSSGITASTAGLPTAPLTVSVN